MCVWLGGMNRDYSFKTVHGVLTLKVWAAAFIYRFIHSVPALAQPCCWEHLSTGSQSAEEDGQCACWPGAVTETDTSPWTPRHQENSNWLGVAILVGPFSNDGGIYKDRANGMFFGRSMLIDQAATTKVLVLEQVWCVWGPEGRGLGASKEIRTGGRCLD